MCDWFGGGSDDSSRQMIDMQKEEAALARKKEADRQLRIRSGLDRIRGAFHGTPVMGTRTVAVPASEKWVTDPATTRQVLARGGQTGGGSGGYGGRGTSDSGAGGGGGGGGTGGGHPIYTTETVPGLRHLVKTAAGTKQESYDTGKRTGGIQPSFFNDFKQGILDYYTPQVAEKYGQAKDETTFRLARAGTLRSSAANDAASELYKQNLINVGDVRNKADAAAADLRSRTAAEEAKATSQLYATENPDVAANQATAAIRNITSEEPPTTALGDIFNVAAIGGAKYMQGADNAAFARRVGALPKPQTRTV
jgi:hypothetical protein